MEERVLSTHVTYWATDLFGLSFRELVHLRRVFMAAPRGRDNCLDEGARVAQAKELDEVWHFRCFEDRLRGDRVAQLTLREFRELDDYSCTVPTGTTIGKKWRRREPYVQSPKGHDYVLGRYHEHPTDERKVLIKWWSIEILEVRLLAELLTLCGISTPNERVYSHHVERRF